MAGRHFPCLFPANRWLVLMTSGLLVLCQSVVLANIHPKKASGIRPIDIIMASRVARFGIVGATSLWCWKVRHGKATTCDESSTTARQINDKEDASRQRESWAVPHPYGPETHAADRFVDPASFKVKKTDWDLMAILQHWQQNEGEETWPVFPPSFLPSFPPSFIVSLTPPS
jgi:hypothetical protein